jgi:hypothetical protein
MMNAQRATSLISRRADRRQQIPNRLAGRFFPRLNLRLTVTL